MASNFQPLSGGLVNPLQRVSLNSNLTNLTLDTDSGNSSLIVQTGSIPSLYIDKFANVGINTTTPNAQLEIAGTGGECLRLRRSGSSTAYTSISMASNGNLSINPNTSGSSITTTASLLVSGPVSISSSLDAIDSTNGGSLTVSGGIAIAKNAFVGSNLTIAGNLFVNGTTTTISSTKISIKDNTLVLNDSPTGINQSGMLINRFQTSNNIGAGNVITDDPNLTTTVVLGGPSTVALSSGSAESNFYNGWWIKVGSQVRQVQSYVGSSKTITVDSQFTNVPSNGAVIQLFNRTYSMFVWDEANKQFAAAFAAIDSTSNLSILEYANVNVANLSANELVSRQLSLTNVQDSLSTSTGALIVAGGVGIAKSIYVGTGIYGTIQTGSQPNITSLGSLSSLTLENLQSGSMVAQTYKSNLYDLSIGVRGTTNPSNPGLAFISYNSNNSVLLNANGNVAFGTTNFSHRVNIGGAINTTDYYLNGNLLNLLSLQMIQSSIPGTAVSSSALVLDANKNITGINSIQSNSIVVGTQTLTGTQAEYLTGIDTGVASANKALILNASKSISGINVLSATNVIVSGINVAESIASSTYLVDITPGTATPSKALVLNNSGSISGISSLQTSTITIGVSSISNEASFLSGSIAGTAAASKVLVLNGSSSISGINSLGISTLVVNGSSISSEASFLSGATAGSAINSKVLVLNSAGVINGITSLGTTSLILGGTTIGATEANYLSSIVPGTATGNKALVIDASKNATGINSLTVNTLVLGLTSLTITEANYIAGNTLGAAIASKALVLDASKNITGINSLQTTTLVIGTASLTETQATYLTSNTPGTAVANKALILNSSLSVSGINRISLTGSIYNSSGTANGRYIGAWDAANTYWGIGFDGDVNTVRIGVCSDMQGTWSSAYANVLANKFISVSDYRLKEDIQPINYGLDAVLKLSPVSYKMKTTQQTELGFIAHEVQTHIPEIVQGEKDKKINDTDAYQSINYVSLIPILIKAMQEQNEKIETQSNIIQDLQRQINSMMDV